MTETQTSRYAVAGASLDKIRRFKGKGIKKKPTGNSCEKKIGGKKAEKTRFEMKSVFLKVSPFWKNGREMMI